MYFDADIHIHTLPVEEARRRLDAKIAAVQEQLSHLRRQRNELAPISRLPTEVLCKIFSTFRFSPSIEYDHKRIHEWIHVTHVCREWRDVCFGYQELWSELRTDTLSYHWIEAMAERSKGVPLSIQWYVSAQSKVGLLHKILQSPSTALKELDLEGEPAHLTEALKRMPVAASLLQSLRVYNSGARLDTWLDDATPKTPVVLSEDFLNGGTPALRTIDLYQCYLPWSSGLFQGLTSLRLRLPPSLAVYRPPTPTQLLDIFSRMPHLEKLELNLELPHMLGNGVDRTVMLPSLTSLKLNGICERVAGLLSCLRIPPSSQVHLRCVQATIQSLDAVAAALHVAWHASPIRSNAADSANSFGGMFQGVIIANNGYNEGLKLACYMSHTRLPNNPRVPEPFACEFSLGLPEEEDSFIDWWPTSPLPSKSCIRLLRTLPLDGAQEVTIGYWLSKEEMGEVLTMLSAVKGLNLEEFGAAKVIQFLLDNATIIKETSLSSSSTTTSSEVIFLPSLEWLQLYSLNVDNRTTSSPTGSLPRERHPVILTSLIGMLKWRASIGKKLRTLEFAECHGVFKADVEKLRNLDIVGEVVWDGVEIRMESEFGSEESYEDDLHYGIDYELDAEYGQWDPESDDEDYNSEY